MNLFWIVALGFAWLAIIAGCSLGWQLLRQNGQMLMRLDELEKRLNELESGGVEDPSGLPLNTPAPDFELPDLAGEAKSLTEFRGQEVLLIFFNLGCGFCRELVPKLAALGANRAEGTGKSSEDIGQSAVIDQNLATSAPLPRLLIISTGGVETNRQLFDEHKVAFRVLVQGQMEVSAAYKANGTPSGYLISREGNIASGLAMGAEALLAFAHGQKSEVVSHKSKADQSLLTSAPAGDGDDRIHRFHNRSLARTKIKRDGLRPGTPAPDFTLPRLDGGELTLTELRGQRVLLVFSSPHCPPCNEFALSWNSFTGRTRI
jgi:peroxiredoxin